MAEFTIRRSVCSLSHMFLRFCLLCSQFTKFLDEIQAFLKANDISYTRIDGSMNARTRIDNMREFGKDEGPKMILCSLMAAGVGINLVSANHCFMMEPAWNRAIEAQVRSNKRRRLCCTR